MPKEPKDRISILSERFRQHAVGRRAENTRKRERRSFYLDGDLTEQLDKTYRDINHALYPHTVSKSTFLETLLEYGLSHLSEIKAQLEQVPQTERSDENT